MKKVATTALIALAVALPSLASAMEKESIHSEKAQMIFEQLAQETRNGE